MENNVRTISYFAPDQVEEDEMVTTAIASYSQGKRTLPQRHLQKPSGEISQNVVGSYSIEFSQVNDHPLYMHALSAHIKFTIICPSILGKCEHTYHLA